MSTLTLTEIERSIRALPDEEQLWLLEHIARQLREKAYAKTLSANGEDMDEQLAAMANNPAIQAELAAISHEFAVAEMDGLEQL